MASDGGWKAGGLAWMGAQGLQSRLQVGVFWTEAKGCCHVTELLDCQASEWGTLCAHYAMADSHAEQTGAGAAQLHLLLERRK